MGQIFVRERNHVGRGAGQPRFAIVAVSGADLRFFARHVRKVELEKLAESVGAQVIYLPRGSKAGEEEGQQGGAHGRRQGRRRSETD